MSLFINRERILLNKTLVDGVIVKSGAGNNCFCLFFFLIVICNLARLTVVRSFCICDDIAYIDCMFDLKHTWR